MSNGTITYRTLLPIGVAFSLLASASTAAWIAASDRSTNLGRLERNIADVAQVQADVRDLRMKLDYLTSGMIRIETKLGTLPTGSRPNP